MPATLSTAVVPTLCLIAIAVAPLVAGSVSPRRIDVSSETRETNAAIAALVSDVRSKADALVFLSGGASKMSSARQRQLLGMFDALAMLARSGRRIAVGDGGTQAGIMEAAGLARQASGNAFPLIGVAPAREIPPRGKTPVDPNHSHIVAVENPSSGGAADAWGSETDMMYWLFGRLASDRPSVTIVANGGGITLKEVEANVQAGRRMILIEGSGRAADALVALLKGTTPAEGDVADLQARAREMRLTERAELYRTVPLGAGASGLRDALIAALDAPK
jgi:outer membrane murein-binding lipoprotein Lpp